MAVIKTVEQQLEEVQTAISKVLIGQSGTWEGKLVSFADLKALNEREEMLLARYNGKRHGIAVTSGVLERDD